MGHAAGTLRAAQRVADPQRRRGSHWTAVGLAFCAIASATGGVEPAGAQTLWDDPAFALYRQAVEAMDKKNYAQAADLAGQAAARYPNHVLAHYLSGQAAALDVYAPRIRLDFRLTDRDGKVLSAGPRELRDPLYLTRAVRLATDPLRYEKNLVQDWFQREFAGPAGGAQGAGATK
jgi:hypothetical protein